MYELISNWQNDGKQITNVVKHYVRGVNAIKQAARMGKDAPDGVWFVVKTAEGKIVYVCDCYGYVRPGTAWRFWSQNTTILQDVK